LTNTTTTASATTIITTTTATTTINIPTITTTTIITTDRHNHNHHQSKTAQSMDMEGRHRSHTSVRSQLVRVRNVRCLIRDDIRAKDLAHEPIRWGRAGVARRDGGSGFQREFLHHKRHHSDSSTCAQKRQRTSSADAP
jgi:hypothetical protein